MSNPQNAAATATGKRGGAFLSQVFVATVNTADPAALTDGNVSMLSVDALGRLRVASGTAGSVVTPFDAESVLTTARVVAPGGGVTIASAAAPAIGLYSFLIAVGYDAGVPVAAVETNNMQFSVSGSVRGTLQVQPVIGIYGPVVRFQGRITAVPSMVYAVTAVANSTAGVGYNAMIVATQIAN